MIQRLPLQTARLIHDFFKKRIHFKGMTKRNKMSAALHDMCWRGVPDRKDPALAAVNMKNG